MYGLGVINWPLLIRLEGSKPRGRENWVILLVVERKNDHNGATCKSRSARRSSVKLDHGSSLSKGDVNEWASSNAMKTSTKILVPGAEMLHAVSSPPSLRADRRLSSAFFKSADFGLDAVARAFEANDFRTTKLLRSHDIHLEPE